MADLQLPMEKKRLMGVVAVLSFGLTSLFAVVSPEFLEFLIPVTFIVGFFIALPLIAILGDDLWFVASEADVPDDVVTTDPVERLRSRYANGEIDETEFERKLERLIETEDLEERTSDRERSLELE